MLAKWGGSLPGQLRYYMPEPWDTKNTNLCEN